MSADPRLWTWRRRAVFLILGGALGVIWTAVCLGTDSAVRVAAVSGGWAAIMLVGSAYIFAPDLPAAWRVLSRWARNRSAES